MPQLIQLQCQQRVNILEVKRLAVMPVTTSSLFKELVTEDRTFQYNGYITIRCARVHAASYNAASSLSMKLLRSPREFSLYVFNLLSDLCKKL